MNRFWTLRKPRLFRAALTLFALAFILGAFSSSKFCSGGAAISYPEPAGNVNDYAGVLSETDIAKIEALVDAVLEQTGATFAVAVVEEHSGESLEMYAANLYEAWGIGQIGEDKGLLVVLSMEERDLRAEVGYGLEPVITDRRAGEILDEMIPYFENGQFGEGLYAGLYHAAQYLAQDAGIVLEVDPGSSVQDYGPSVPPGKGSPLGMVLGVLLGVPLIVGAFLGMRRRRCPRCKARLATTDKVVQGATYDVGGLALRVRQCPQCGYRDERPYRTPRLSRPGGIGRIPPSGGPFGGFRGGSSGKGGSRGPRGLGGGRSGGGGASRKW